MTSDEVISVAGVIEEDVGYRDCVGVTLIVGEQEKS